MEPFIVLQIPGQYDGVLAFDIVTGQCLREAVYFETQAGNVAGLQNKIYQITRAPGSPFVGSIFNASQPELFVPGQPLVRHKIGFPYHKHPLHA